MAKLLYPELSYKISGICFHVQNNLGRFGREKQYADKLEEQLKNEKTSYLREFEIRQLEPSSPTGNRVDFLINELILLELKAKSL